MTKLLTRLYPIDIDRMEWQPVAGAEGLRQKLLAEDPDNGSITRLLAGDPGARMPAGTRETWEETYVLDGTLTLGDWDAPKGSYLCAAPGSERPELTSADGFTALQALDHNDKLDKPNVQLHADEIEAMEWAQTPLRNEAHVEKILATGPSGSTTRLLLVKVGGDTTELDDHDFDEEVLILEGIVKNGEELHPAGTYTFNRPHDTHGPFLIPEPLLCYEIRNYS
jgi:hypothetical protein